MLKFIKFLGLVLVAGIAAANCNADTVTSVTQYNYNAVDRPLCTALRMSPTTYATGLPANACTTVSPDGIYGPDRITKYAYSPDGLVTEIDQGVGTTTTRIYARYTYSPVGQKLSEEDANNNRTEFSYDEFDRLKQITYSSPSPGANSVNPNDYESFSYDDNGNLTIHRLRDAKSISYTYDNLNRQISKTTSDGSIPPIYTNYDLHNRPCITAFSTDVRAWGPDCTALFSNTTAAVYYKYDGLGRVTATKDTNGRIVSYLYNSASAKTRVTYPDASFVDYGSALSGFNKLDALNRVTDPKHSSGSTLYTLRYDSLGRRIAMSRGPLPHTVTTYTYDNLGRVTAFGNDLAGSDTTNDVTWQFSYNPAGQVVSRYSASAVYNYVPVLANLPAQGYDGLNRDANIALVNGNTGYDQRGNLANEGATNIYNQPGRRFTYDLENRLLSVAPSASPTLHNTDLIYDPEGRLAKYSRDNGLTWTTFVYDGTNLIAEYNGATATVLATYVFGPGVDEPIVWYQGAGFGSRHFLIANYQGSIIGTTNTAATLEQSYEYGPYGEPQVGRSVTADPWATSAPRFRYTGQTALYDAHLYYYKARVYDPAYGNFLQTDPIGSKDDLDLYAYVKGDPINASDPMGLSCTGGDICDSVSAHAIFSTQEGTRTYLAGGIAGVLAAPAAIGCAAGGCEYLAVRAYLWLAHPATGILAIRAAQAANGAVNGDTPAEPPAVTLTMNESKFSYLFGNAAADAHNTPRSNQLAMAMKVLGISDNGEGRALLFGHFQKTVNTAGNVVSKFSNEWGNFEVRDSLLFGPSGRSVKMESTFQIMDDGSRTFSTTIPKGNF